MTEKIKEVGERVKSNMIELLTIFSLIIGITVYYGGKMDKVADRLILKMDKISERLVNHEIRLTKIETINEVVPKK